MLIICDSRLPEDLKANLRKRGEVLEFKTQGIVYDSISGHPDIFFHRVGKAVIYAPNTPSKYLEILNSLDIKLIRGEKFLKINYPDTVYYNAVADKKRLFCHSKFVDSTLIKAHAGKEIFHLNQGYAACNMVVGSQSILTSDKGIHKLIKGYYINPVEIQLLGFDYGFIGGSCTIYQNMLLLNGSLDYISDSAVIESFAKENYLTIVELYEGPLVDGGGLLFL